MMDYKKYRWFYTSSGKLVVGGKNAEQNDELVKKMQDTKKDYCTMHTSDPGSPFSIIVEPVEKVSDKDMEECATFTGCFSRAWKEGKKKTKVDMFKLSQLSKRPGMKVGMWAVSGKIKSKGVELKLVLIKQNNVLRAVPEQTAKKSLMMVCPGKNDKKIMAAKFAVTFDSDKISYEELMSALPAGGVRICK